MGKPTLSKGEMEIARVLWDVGPAAVRAVHEAACEQREIDFSTVQTYLRRLETKGYATSTLQGRIRIYAAKEKPQAVIRDTVNDLVTRLFGGNAMPLVRHLIEEQSIDADDISELKRLVDQLEESHNDSPEDKEARQ